jgi:hypothetical protein
MTYNVASSKTMDGTPQTKQERFARLGRTEQQLSRGYSELDVILSQVEIMEAQEREYHELRRAQGTRCGKSPVYRRIASSSLGGKSR